MAVYKLELRLGSLRPGLAAGGKENDDAGEDMGHLVLREQDLFGDAAGDGVLPESWGRVINRISDKVEFECAGFRYIGPEIAVPIQETDGNNALSNLPKPGDEWVYVNSAKALDECLWHIEDISGKQRGRGRANMTPIQVFLIPRVELVIYDDGGDDTIGSIKLDPYSSSWSSFKTDIRRISGRDASISYEKTGGAGGVAGKSVPTIVSGQHHLEACMSYVMSRGGRDFSLDVDVVPHAASVSIIPDGEAVARPPATKAEHSADVASARGEGVSAVSMWLEVEGEGGGGVKFNGADTFAMMIAKLEGLECVDPGKAVRGFLTSDEVEVVDEEAWRGCKTKLMTTRSEGAEGGRGRRRNRMTLGVSRLLMRDRRDGEGVTSQDDVNKGESGQGATELRNQQANAKAGGGWGEGGEAGVGEGGGRGGHLESRKPLVYVTLMCYDDAEADPVKVTIRADTTWRELSARLASIFGENVKLAFSQDSSSVRTVGSEGELRDCIDSMQELWMLGASAGVLHCAAISDEASLPNASSKKAGAGGASAVDGGLPSIDAAQGAEPHKDERRLTCLHLAADSGDSDRMYGCITGKVCRKGDVRVDVNAKDTDGATPLHYAVSGGHTKCAEILLSNRAHLHAADDYGCTALHTATAETMKLLILNGARLNVPDSEGWTPLHKACAINSVPEASLLIESMADVDIPSRIGFTPLHVAARYGSVEAQDLLIAANAEVLARTSDGQVAQELAEAGRCSPKLLTAHKEANSALNAIKRRELGRQEGKSVEGLVTRIMSMFTDKNGEFYRQGRTIYDIFQQFDTDKDGTLTLTEFHEALSGPPFYIKYSDRDSLRSYIDVDGDDVIEIDEFATALLGLPPPTSDKDIIRTAIDSLDLRLPVLLDSTIRSVCLSIDFLSQHRSGAYSKEHMVQVGSRQLPVREGRIPVKHQQRLCVAEGGEAQWSSNRRGIFEGLDDGTDDALSVEIILYGEFELPDGEVSVRELGSGKASMVPEDISSNDVREEKKVAIYTQIASAAELPSKWSEASLPRLRALLGRVPISVQNSLVCRDGVPPTRGQVIDCLSSWEKTSGAPRASPAKGGNASGVKKADMDPIAEAHIHIGALPVLDAMVVELAKRRGFASLQDRWKQRWKAN